MVVVFASSLICSSFLSFWSSEECKRKARRENINFINFWGGVSGKAVSNKDNIIIIYASSEKKSKKKKLKKQKQVMADVITIIV